MNNLGSSGDFSDSTRFRCQTLSLFMPSSIAEILFHIMFIGLSREGLRMLEQERVNLRCGLYRTPKCSVGRCLGCVMRGKIAVAGLSDAPIQWPYVPQPGGNGYRSLILCGDLVRAVRRESGIAVAHWW